MREYEVNGDEGDEGVPVGWAVVIRTTDKALRLSIEAIVGLQWIPRWAVHSTSPLEPSSEAGDSGLLIVKQRFADRCEF